MADENTGVAAATDAVVDPLLAPRPTAKDRADQVEASRQAHLKDIEERTKPADIGAAAATKIEGSGAILEDGAKKMVDVSHPAVDNNPRAGTTVVQNKIDFNDPSLYDDEAVAKNLSA